MSTEDGGHVLRVDGRPVAEAEAAWQVSGPAPNITPSALELPRVELPPVARDAGSRPFRYRQVVRTYQVGPDHAVRPQVILQWLEHAVFRAAARAGWPVERMAGAGFLSLVIGHQLVLGAPAGESDELEITSRFVELRRVSGSGTMRCAGGTGRSSRPTGRGAPSSTSRATSGRRPRRCSMTRWAESRAYEKVGPWI